MQRVRIDASGLWISKPGRPSTSASDDDYLVTPNRNLNQPYLSGFVTSVSNLYSTSNGFDLYYQAVVAHNLGYAPVALCFGADVDGNRPTVSVDAANLTLTGQGTGTTYAVSWFYIIFRTPLG